MDNIATQFAHIFIHYYSNKVSSACKLFISEPTQNQEKKMGRLFGIIEINTPSHENTQLITQIINQLEEIYYSKIETEELNFEKIFEQTLKEINQKFTQLIREKQFHLVGNLNEYTIKEKINLVIGLQKENQVLLSYLNNVGLFLIHKGKQDYKIIDIKKLAPGEAPTLDEKNSNLFANFIFGEANPPDFLFLANSGFLDYISLERIQKIIVSLSINKAAEYFKNALLQFEGHNFAAIIIKNTFVEPTKEKEPQSLTSITELNYTEFSTEKLLAPSFWTSLKHISNSLLKLTKQKSKDLNIQKENKIEIENQEKIPPHKSSTKFSIIFIPLQNFLISLKKQFKNLFSQNLFLNERLQRLKNYWRLKFAYLGTYLKKIPNLSKILLTVAIFLIILFVYSTSYFKNQQTKQASSTEFQNIVNQIEEKKNQAESDIIIGAEDKARSEITDAQKLLTTLNIESQNQRETSQGLNKEIEAVIAKLRHITTIDEPTLITDLSVQEDGLDIKNIIYQNTIILAFDSTNNNVYQINIDNRQVKKISSNLKDIGSILVAKKIDNKILIYHDKNGFVQFLDDKFTPFDVNLNSNGKLVDFVTYNNRLYTIDVNANQIYRQEKTETGYGPGTAWLKTKLDLKNIVSMAIDTNIWLLDQNSQILKFNKGIKQNFTIKNLEPQLESPIQLFTSDGTNYLYILEPKNKRIVVLDKTGNLITQYFSEAFDNLKNSAISEKEKKIFLVNDNKILFINLTHLK